MTLTTSKSANPAPRLEAPSGSLGRATLASLLTGIVGVLVLTVGLLPGAPEHQIIGSTLTLFGAGWAMLAFLSARMSSRPQRWAYVPAVVMSLAGVVTLVLAPDDTALSASGWVWPVVLGGLAAWMATSIRRARAGRAAWMLYPVVALLAAAAVGGMVTTVGAHATADQYPMPGRAYTVDGHQLHLDCAGAGSPTVVLENGLGLSSPAWARITAAVGATTRVCAHDRAGQGWSEVAAQPQDARAAAQDLHALLAAAGEQGPFIIAGHSAGGVYAMTYAATYPDDVAGLVLLDSMSPHQFTLVPSYPRTYEMLRRLYTVLGPLTRLGLGPVLADAASNLPDTAAAELHAIQLRASTYDNARDEVSLYRQILEQAQALTSFGPKPLVVLTATGTAEDSPGWMTAQDELARLSASSSHRVVDTTHVGVLLTAAGSDASVRAITDVVDAVRRGDPVVQQ